MWTRLYNKRCSFLLPRVVCAVISVDREPDIIADKATSDLDRVKATLLQIRQERAVEVINVLQVAEELWQPVRQGEVWLRPPMVQVPLNNKTTAAVSFRS